MFCDESNLASAWSQKVVACAAVPAEKWIQGPVRTFPGCQLLQSCRSALRSRQYLLDLLRADVFSSFIVVVHVQFYPAARNAGDDRTKSKVARCGRGLVVRVSARVARSFGSRVGICVVEDHMYSSVTYSTQHRNACETIPTGVALKHFLEVSTLSQHPLQAQIPAPRRMPRLLLCSGTTVSKDIGRSTAHQEHVADKHINPSLGILFWREARKLRCHLVESTSSILCCILSVFRRTALRCRDNR